MSHQIVIQPDGKLAIWSTGVDNFIMNDAIDQEIIDYYGKKAKVQAEADTRKLIKELRQGKNPYAQFGLTWEEMLDGNR